MIEFSCHTWTFHDLTLTDALGTIARLGFRYVDIGSGPHFNAANADPRRAIDRIIAELRLFNLRLADFYLMLPRISLADESLRRKDIDLFKSLVPLMEALGTPGVTLSPGLAHAPDDHSAFQRTIEALCEMVEAAGDNLSVSVEPHLDSMAEKPESALRLIEAVPGLSLTLDWAHFTCQGYHTPDLLPLLPHTRHVHLRQAAKNKLQTPFVDGKIDIREVLDALDGYTGKICIEYMKDSRWHGTMPVNTLRETTKLRDVLREAMRETEQQA